MEVNEVKFPVPEGPTVYFAAMGDRPRVKAFELTKKLRDRGVSAEFDHMDRSFKAQFKYANKIGAKYTVALGDEELDRGMVKAKCMADGSEKELPIEALTEYFI